MVGPSYKEIKRLISGEEEREAKKKKKKKALIVGQPVTGEWLW